jgi:hypothetical protein
VSQPERGAGRIEEAIALGATPLLPLVGLIPGGRWVLPLVAPLALWPAFARRVRSGRYRAAFGAAMLWTALYSGGVILFAEVAPRSAAAAILHAEPYRQEMFGWVERGEAPENHPSQFLPQHALHFAGFALLAYVSGGYLGLALGAALLGYMSYFVGSFAASMGAPVGGAVLAWVPWAVLRVLSFVAIGCILARPLLIRRPWPFGRREWRWILVALLGILADALLKAAAAPAYGRFLGALLARASGAG